MGNDNSKSSRGSNSLPTSGSALSRSTYERSIHSGLGASSSPQPQTQPQRVIINTYKTAPNLPSGERVSVNFSPSAPDQSGAKNEASSSNLYPHLDHRPQVSGSSQNRTYTTASHQPVRSVNINRTGNQPVATMTGREPLQGRMCTNIREPSSEPPPPYSHSLFGEGEKKYNKSKTENITKKYDKSEQENKSVMQLSFLLDLSGKESSKVVDALKGQKNEFENTLKEPISPSVLTILMKLVRKICVSDHNDEKMELLKLIWNDNFLSALGDYISDIPTHQKDSAEEDRLFIVECVLPFFETALQLIPRLVHIKMRELIIKTVLTVNGVEQYQNIQFGNDIKRKLKELESRLNIQPSDEDGQMLGKKSEQKLVNKNLHVPVQKKSADTDMEIVLLNVTTRLNSGVQKVRGMQKEMFFVDNIEGDEDLPKRGIFLLAFAQYLLTQQYKVKDIIILAFDETVMQIMVEIKKNWISLKGLAVKTSNSSEKLSANIILIPLAVNESRSAAELCGSDFFGKALSAAKDGIYMIGNLSLLEQHSPFWKCMKPILQQHQVTASHLPLLCATHKAVTSVASAQDFRVVKNGGCARRCEQKVACGHQCRRLCHSDDKEHKKYMCREKCTKKPEQCSMDHPCPKLCHEDCGLCTTIIDVQNVKVVCHALYSVFQNQKYNVAGSSQASREERTSEKTFDRTPGVLPCGHPLPHNTQLKTKQALQLDPLSSDLVDLCQVPCSATLDCGHACSGTCGKCWQGKVHMPCSGKKKIILACGHRAYSSCNTPVAECYLKCFYECSHGKCRERCGVPCTPCKEMCVLRCAHSRCTKKCDELCDRLPCKAPCKELLSCGHACIGFCGEPCPPGPENCRVCNPIKMKKCDRLGVARFVLLRDCNHVVRANDLDRRIFNKQHEVEALACPICGYNIVKTSRYSNYVKHLLRNLLTVRHVNKQYRENIAEKFWNIGKEIQSLSLPAKIGQHPKVKEIKELLKVATSPDAVNFEAFILLAFVRNLLSPTICGGKMALHNLEWLLHLLVERYKTNFSTQVLKELYKEVHDYQKSEGMLQTGYLLELHKVIAFSHLLEKGTWSMCSQGHLSSCDSLVTECSACDLVQLNM